MDPKVADPSVWAEFGLPGLVILALFLLLVFLLKTHKDERKEWREDAGERQAKTDTVIQKLEDAIVVICKKQELR